MARQITVLGGHVRRIIVVGDTLDEIASALHDALSREPFLIITTGGLGPTFDDMTLEAIAGALKSPLTLNEEALKIVKERYHKREVETGIKMELTPARLKMATLPRDAKPLPNSVGAAPGVLINSGKSKIVSLPGVPNEMESIFEGSIKTLISGAAGNAAFGEKSLDVILLSESAISPLIDETMRGYPTVYIKSHPKLTEARPHIELHLTTTAKSRIEADETIEAAAKRISKLIIEHGGSSSTIYPNT